jgi:hypothetical protein
MVSAFAVQDRGTRRFHDRIFDADRAGRESPTALFRDQIIHRQKPPFIRHSEDNESPSIASTHTKKILVARNPRHGVAFGVQQEPFSPRESVSNDPSRCFRRRQGMDLGPSALSNRERIIAMKPRKRLRQAGSGIANSSGNIPVKSIGRRWFLGIGGLATGGLVLGSAGRKAHANLAATGDAESSATSEEPTDHQRRYYSKARF